MKSRSLLVMLSWCLASLATLAQAQQTLPRDMPAAPAAVDPNAPIAVILPLKSPDFRRAADAVLSGIAAARVALGGTAPIVVQETDGTPESTRDAFAAALVSNPRAIIGPLTRSALQGIPTDALTAPTLVLNSVETDTPVANLWTFGLGVESEAEQVANIAINESRLHGGNPTAVVLKGGGPLQQRAAQAFTAAFTLGGGTVSATLNVPPSSGADLKRQVAQANPSVVFLALDSARASNARPWLRDANCWGTSQLNSGGMRSLAIDLEGVHFVDLPWLVQHDSPALAPFLGNDASTQFGPELSRLYALGLDAWSIALGLSRGTASFDLDGATGRLTVLDNHVERRSTTAIFRNGDVEFDGLQ
jgi:outer membrane PBP1 activator LpoA protein